MIHKHHIIPFHEWKANIDPTVTRGDKEFNSPGNIVYLSTEQHAQAHQLLYELFKNEYDLIAYQTLSGQIGKTEAWRRANDKAHRGRYWKQTPDAINKIKAARLLQVPPRLGFTTSKDTKLKQSMAAREMYKITTPSGSIEIVTGLKQYCQANGLQQQNMVHVSKGRRTHHKGFSCERMI